MARKKLNFIVPLVIYPHEILVSLGQTDDELKIDLENRGIEFNDSFLLNGQGRFILCSNLQSVIRLWNFPSDCEIYGTLQHEIFHCVTVVLDRMGMKFTVKESAEAYAYLIGYLTTEIYKQINKNNEKL